MWCREQAPPLKATCSIYAPGQIEGALARENTVEIHLDVLVEGFMNLVIRVIDRRHLFVRHDLHRHNSTAMTSQNISLILNGFSK